MNKKLIGVESINGKLVEKIFKCDCGIPEFGYLFAFKDRKTMRKYLNPPKEIQVVEVSHDIDATAGDFRPECS